MSPCSKLAITVTRGLDVLEEQRLVIKARPTLGSFVLLLFRLRYSSAASQLRRVQNKKKKKRSTVFLIQDNQQLRFIQENKMSGEEERERQVSFLSTQTIYLFNPPITIPTPTP